MGPDPLTLDEARAIGQDSAVNDRVPGRIGRVHQVSISAGGVPKRPVERAWVAMLGLAGDSSAESGHRGPDRAVVIYSVEAIRRVAADGNTAFPGAFGENLTVADIDWDALREGDRLAIGEDGLLLELVKYTSPCETIAHYFPGGRIARISPKVHPEDARWCARVLSEGWVAPGNLVEVISAEERGAETTQAPLPA